MNTTQEHLVTPQQHQISSGGLSVYKEMVAPGLSWPGFFGFELFTLVISPLPGLIGFGLRSLCMRPFLKSCGSRPLIGRSVTWRGAKRIELHDRVMIEDFAVIDCRASATIILGEKASIGRFSTVVCKGQKVLLGVGTNIGSYCRIATESSIEIGEGTLVAAYCYIGPGNHQIPSDDKPIISAGMEESRGVRLGRAVWIGTRATILDGVTIGDGAIVGAHSLVREDVPAGAIVAGAPARIIGQREVG